MCSNNPQATVHLGVRNAMGWTAGLVPRLIGLGLDAILSIITNATIHERSRENNLPSLLHAPTGPFILNLGPPVLRLRI